MDKNLLISHKTWIIFEKNLFKNDCYYLNQGSYTQFAMNLLSLRTLSLNCSCPGALTVKDFSTNSTKTFAAWKTEDHITLPYRQCAGQQSFCSFQQTDSAFNNCKCETWSRQPLYKRTGSVTGCRGKCVFLTLSSVGLLKRYKRV